MTHNTTATCRVCLEPCIDEEYCCCQANLLIHESCLLKYLETRPKGINSDCCEICRHPYDLQYRAIWVCTSSTALYRRLLSRKLQFAFYIAMIVAIVGYLCFFIWLMVVGRHSHLVKIITITLAVCSLVALIAVVRLLIRTYFIRRRRVMVGVMPMSKSLEVVINR